MALQGITNHSKDCSFTLSVSHCQLKIQHLWRCCLLPLVGTTCSSNSLRSSCPQLASLIVAALMTHPRPGPWHFPHNAQKILSIWNWVTTPFVHSVSQHNTRANSWDCSANIFWNKEGWITSGRRKVPALQLLSSPYRKVKTSHRVKLRLHVSKVAQANTELEIYHPLVTI